MPQPTVISVNTSRGGIPKRPLEVGRVRFSGLEGDGHNFAKHGGPLQAVSLIDVEDLENLRNEGFQVYPGATGENLTLRNLECDVLEPGDRLRFSGGVELEITKRRKPCFVLDAISPQLKTAIIGRCGCLAKVITEGEIRAGENVEVLRAASMSPAGR